ncbi:MAG TPA: hypothetical protein VF328_09790, partial [Mycobacterium sp.]
MDQLTDEVIAFISERTRAGMLGYTASAGRPLVAPVWLVGDSGELARSRGSGCGCACGSRVRRQRDRPGR